MQKSSSDSLYYNRNFLLLWVSQIFSQTGISFLNFVLAISAFQVVKLKSNFFGVLIETNQAVSLIVASYGLAAFLFGVPAGVLVDKLNRKQTLYYSSIIRFLLVLILIYSNKSLEGLVIYTFLLNSVSQFFYPAESAVLPSIVKEKELVAANTIYNLTYFLSQILGYLVGGILIFSIGFDITIFIVALFFLVAAIAVKAMSFADIKTDNLKPLLKDLPETLTNGFREAIIFIRQNDGTKVALYYLGVVQIIIGIFWALQPGLSVEVLGIKIQNSGLYIVAPIVVGMVIGSVFINKHIKRIKEHIFIESSVIIASLAFLGIYFLDFRIRFPRIVPAKNIFDSYNNIRFLPDLNTLTIAIILMFLIGFASAFLFVVYNTKLQLSTKDEVRGRVYGILQSIVTVSGALPVLLSGYIADKFGVKEVFLGIGLFLVIFHSVLKFRYKNRLS